MRSFLLSISLLALPLITLSSHVQGSQMRSQQVSMGGVCLMFEDSSTCQIAGCQWDGNFCINAKSGSSLNSGLLDSPVTILNSSPIKLPPGEPEEPRNCLSDFAPCSSDSHCCSNSCNGRCVP